MRVTFPMMAVLAAAIAAPAMAQTAAPKIERPAFGDTALVANPCPPMPKVLADYLALPPQEDRVPPGEVIAAYGAYNSYVLANDWGGKCRYREANRAVAGGPRPRAVFMGDSITDNWARLDPDLFSGGVVGRGISGQTTPQMVVRFYQDVIALKPRVVHIMAGTNDVAGNTGPTSDDQYRDNISAMVELARANGIAVVLASIPPAKTFSWRAELKPSPKIRELNRWLSDYAKAKGLTYVDYYSALAGPEGELPLAYGRDGVHPLKAGYAVMRPLTLQALAKAEREQKPR